MYELYGGTQKARIFKEKKYNLVTTGQPEII